jgi:xanthine dehydrogenase small subunit
VIQAPNPTLTLLDWLRDHRRLTGTKEGCAEGDCGACTVMAVEPGGQVRALNACIQLLPMLDGCALVTVEGLSDGRDLGHLQRLMVEEHGSQCGFCTPGLVMALHVHHARGGSADQASVSEAIAGNLCRCTGYGPILRAGERACALPRPAAPAAPEANPDPLGYEMSDGQGPRRFFAPTRLSDLLALADTHRQATIVAGATDVGLWITKQGRRIETLISLMCVAELQELRDLPDQLIIGAGVRYADALTFLTRLHPAVGAFVRRIGAMQVRDAGTIGGNIANGSPIGDMPPVLIALGARLRLCSVDGQREIPLENYFLDYGKQDRSAGEIVAQIVIPKPAEGDLIAAEKLTKRIEQDISSVSCGAVVSVEQGQVASIRIAFGGMAGIPKRATHVEAALLGKAWDQQQVSRAAEALEHDFAPLTDWRGSAAYRMAAARGLLMRFVHETSGETGPRVTELRSVADA